MLQTAPTDGKFWDLRVANRAYRWSVWSLHVANRAYRWKILGFAPALFAKFLAIRRIIMYNT